MPPCSALSPVSSSRLSHPDSTCWVLTWCRAWKRVREWPSQQEVTSLCCGHCGGHWPFTAHGKEAGGRGETGTPGSEWQKTTIFKAKVTCFSVQQMWARKWALNYFESLLKGRVSGHVIFMFCSNEGVKIWRTVVATFHSGKELTGK